MHELVVDKALVRGRVFDDSREAPLDVVVGDARARQVSDGLPLIPHHRIQVVTKFGFRKIQIFSFVREAGPGTMWNGFLSTRYHDAANFQPNRSHVDLFRGLSPPGGNLVTT